MDLSPWRDEAWGKPIRNEADVQAINAVPIDERLSRYHSTFDVFEELAAEAGTDDALTYLPDPSANAVETVTYKSLRDNIARAANLFASAGTDSEAVVSVLMRNTPRTHYAIWGAEAVGVVAPINPNLGTEGITALIRANGSRTLVVGGDVLRSVGLEVDAIRRFAPTLEHVFAAEEDIDGLLRFEAACEAQSTTIARRLHKRSVRASFYHTGGTTGRPKIAIRSHSNELANAWATAAALGFRRDDVIACGLPLFHVNGTMVTGLAAFLAGARVVLAGPAGYRDPALLDHFWDMLATHGVTTFAAVPTLLSALLDRPVASAGSSNLRFAICGAAPLTVELRRRFESRTGVGVLEGYGLTEATCSTTLNPRDGVRKTGSIGIPVPYADVLVARAVTEPLQQCAPGEIGRLLVRGPHVFEGYLEGSVEQPVDGAGWLDTGDLASRDEDGFVHLEGRAKDVIIRGGHNIDPRAIEEAVGEHPDVLQTAAIGKPDQRVGELPVAFVTIRGGATIGQADLLAFARMRIGERAAVPVEVTILGEMPVTAIGKIDKPALRRMVAQGSPPS